jgi:hypothetical protein
MLKKSLIALALVAFLGLPALAHEDWGYSVETIWHWDCKPASVNPIPVKMKIVMWADVYWDQDSHQIVIQQVDGGTFEGCANFKVCVNFPGLKIKGEITNKTSGVASKWYLSVGLRNDAPGYGGDNGKDELLVPGVHLTGNNLPIKICVKATGVDPQALEYSMGSLVQVAVVNLTLCPTLNP